VAPFRNAPPPWKDPNPSDYGVKKDTRKLNQVMNPQDLGTVDNFLKEVIDFRMTQSFLGIVTDFADKLAYLENGIYSERLNILYDVHDLLVDAPKQAYQFGDKEFKYLTQQQLKCENLAVPAYKQAIESVKKSRLRGEENDNGSKGLSHNPDNILDFLYFDVVKEHNKITLQALKDRLPREDDDDPDLRSPFLQMHRKGDHIIRHELKVLQTGLEKVMRTWNRSFGDRSELSSERYDKLLEKCYDMFRKLMPSENNKSHPEISPLLYPYLGPNHPAIWETIRASAVYTAFPRKHSFVWNMAGRELARLKAATNADTYNVVPDVFADLKTKPSKVTQANNEEEDSGM
jgi:hypothetical protein